MDLYLIKYAYYLESSTLGLILMFFIHLFLRTVIFFDLLIWLRALILRILPHCLQNMLMTKLVNIFIQAFVGVLLLQSKVLFVENLGVFLALVL